MIECLFEKLLLISDNSFSCFCPNLFSDSLTSFTLFSNLEIIFENFLFFIASAVVTPKEARATAELTYVIVLLLFEFRGG